MTKPVQQSNVVTPTPPSGGEWSLDQKTGQLVQVTKPTSHTPVKKEE